MRVLQVAGRRLLAGDSSLEEQPSNEELYLQSYRNCTPQQPCYMPASAAPPAHPCCEHHSPFGIALYALHAPQCWTDQPGLVPFLNAALHWCAACSVLQGFSEHRCA